MVIRSLYIHLGQNFSGRLQIRTEPDPDRSRERPVSGSRSSMGTWTHTLHQETDGDESLLKRDERTASVRLKEVVGCTHADCHCECFLPGRHQIRSCDRCGHGWVAHAVGKVCGPAPVCSGQVEIVQSHVVFDISSLILYGTQALPVQMKILLDRLFSVLTHTQVLNIIHTFGWTLRDYVRGYMLQDSMGKVLDRWVTMSPEDEVVTLRQFLRFGETKSIVELMSEEIRPETAFRAMERSGVRHSPRETLQHFENLPGGTLAFLQPFHYISPSPFPPSPALVPHPATQKLQRLSEQNHGEMRPRNPRGTSLLRKHDEQRLRPPIADSSGTRERRHGSSSSKVRVSCSACAKTFYDKGTLKIHFNAVHLKIKHRCTIAGCNMMFSSLRSRNRHSANPNPRLHAALQHAARRFSTQPRRTPLPVSMATNNTDHRKDLPGVCEAHGISGGGATGSRSANQNSLGDVIGVTPKKKSRKSSTPLKLKREICSEDDDRITISPRQPVSDLHGNKHHIFNTHTQYKHLDKTAYGYHSNVEERNDWMTGEISRVDDEWKGRFRPLLKVKEELCGPTCDCRGHRHSNL